MDMPSENNDDLARRAFNPKNKQKSLADLRSSPFYSKYQ